MENKFTTQMGGNFNESVLVETFVLQNLVIGDQVRDSEMAHKVFQEILQTHPIEASNCSLYPLESS